MLELLHGGSIGLLIKLRKHMEGDTAGQQQTAIQN